jgi:hypothetical protein
MQKGIEIAHCTPLHFVSFAVHAKHWTGVHIKRTIGFQQSMSPEAVVNA